MNQKYHLTEETSVNPTLWIIEKYAPNSGVVIFETEDKELSFKVLENLNNKNCECDNKDCKSYDETAEWNCGINTFTFGISFCQRYMGIP